MVRGVGGLTEGVAGLARRLVCVPYGIQASCTVFWINVLVGSWLAFFQTTTRSQQCNSFVAAHIFQQTVFCGTRVHKIASGVLVGVVQDANMDGIVGDEELDLVFDRVHWRGRGERPAGEQGVLQLATKRRLAGRSKP